MPKKTNKQTKKTELVTQPAPYLAKKQYRKRRDLAARKIYWFLRKKYGFEGKTYEHIPGPVLENEKCKRLWNISIQTDKEIEPRRPGMVHVKRIERTCLIIDVVIPADQNDNMKEREKMGKHQDLKIELQKQ